MVVIGIDPGTATTGYGVVEESSDGQLALVKYGVIITKPGSPPEKRLKEIFEQISKILAIHQPNSGAVEKLFFQRNVTNAMAVGQARGVIMLAMANYGVQVAEYTPTEIKSTVTGYGAADKYQVQSMVQILLKLNEKPQPDDAADALAIAICHLHSTGYSRLIQ